LALILTCVAIRWYTGADAANAQLPPATRQVAPAPQARQAKPAPQAAPASRNATAAKPDATKLKVMAIVNSKPITREALAHECLRRFGKEVAESLVNKHLILQQCRAQGIEITKADVDVEIERMATKFGLSVDRWLALLQEEREVSAQKYRNEIIWPTLALRELARDQIQVTPEEITHGLEADFGPKVKVLMLASATQAEAERLRQQAVAKPDEFGVLAKDHSIDKNSASARGMIPPIRMHMGDEQIEQIAFSMKKNDISQVISVANQFILLKCEGQIPAIVIPPEHMAQAKTTVADHIRDQKMRSAATDLFAKLQQQAQVVNIFNKPDMAKQMPGVAVMINDERLTMNHLAEECLKRFGEEVLIGEINRVLLMEELNRRRLEVTQADIDQEISQAAVMYGYTTENGTPDIEAWLGTVVNDGESTVELYVRDAVWPSVALKKLVEGDVQISQEDLEKGFSANYGERVDVMAVVMNDLRQAQKVWEMARANPAQEYFAQLASQYSIEPSSRSNGGHVPPLRMHGGQPNLEKEAFKLQAGELSGIIAVADSYVILRCLGRTKPVVTSIEEVREELTRDLRERNMRMAMTSEFNRLTSIAQIDNFLTGTTQAGGQVRQASAEQPVRRPSNNVRQATAPGQSALPLLQQ
jgi:parvulin-like peptidyl-prolyl isomerase